MPSVMNHSFSNVPISKLPRSTFNRTSRTLTTFDADFWIPIYFDEVLPGDNV